MLKKLIAGSALAAGAFGLTMVVAAPAFADVNGNGATSVVMPLSTPPAVNPCTGDLVGFIGTIHIVIHETLTGNTAHLLLQDNLRLTGTASDGTGYVLTGGDITNLNVAAGSTMTMLRHLNVMSQGSDPNLAASLQEHITIDADGNVTVNVDNLDFDCTP